MIIGVETPSAQEDLFLESHLLSLKKAQAPELRTGRAILTHNGNPAIRTVGVRFAHEDFRILHVFQRNPNDVFFIVYEVPFDVDLLKYRIMVDGLWMSDPLNPALEWDELRGVRYSVLAIASRAEPVITNPEVKPDSRLRFVYRGAAGRRVYLVGDFNDWNPYRHPLQENEGHPGTYSISLELGPGRHHYGFLVDGVAIADPRNTRRLIDRSGREVSYFDLAP